MLENFDFYIISEDVEKRYYYLEKGYTNHDVDIIFKTEEISSIINELLDYGELYNNTSPSTIQKFVDYLEDLKLDSTLNNNNHCYIEYLLGYVKEIYWNKCVQKYLSYEYQKNFLEEYPEKILMLQKVGFHKKISKEYADLIELFGIKFTEKMDYQEVDGRPVSRSSSMGLNRNFDLVKELNLLEI